MFLGICIFVLGLSGPIVAADSARQGPQSEAPTEKIWSVDAAPFEQRRGAAKILVKPLRLKQVSSKASKVIDVEDWLRAHGFEMPRSPLDVQENRVRVPVPSKNDGPPVSELWDFSKWSQTGQEVKEDLPYTKQEVTWAERVGDILYVSHGHRTYAKSSAGLNAWISAIDLSSGALLWRSEPLVSNAQNFLIVGDVIVCGYGFTAEPDFIRQLNRHTGETLQKIPVPSGPELLLMKDSRLFVRTYNRDLQFSVEGL